MFKYIKISSQSPILKQDRLNINLSWADIKLLNQQKNNYHNFVATTKINKKEVARCRKLYLEAIYN